MVEVVLKILKTYLQLLKTNNIDEYEIYLERLYKLQNEFDRQSAIKYQLLLKGGDNMNRKDIENMDDLEFALMQVMVYLDTLDISEINKLKIQKFIYQIYEKEQDKENNKHNGFGR